MQQSEMRPDNPEYMDFVRELTAAAGDRFKESQIIPKFVNRFYGRPKLCNGKSYKGDWKAFYEKICFGLSTCWYWRGAKNHLGYGLFKRNRAHRFAYQYFNGPIPQGLSVLHKCDVRNCVNPEHLFVGTQLENMKDAITKGRLKTPTPQRGSSNPMCKYNQETVLEIRAKYATEKYTQISLAREYGMSPMNVSRIINRQLWSHI